VSSEEPSVEEPPVEVEEPRDEPEETPGPAGELDLFG